MTDRLTEINNKKLSQSQNKKKEKREREREGKSEGECVRERKSEMLVHLLPDKLILIGPKNSTR